MGHRQKEVEKLPASSCSVESSFRPHQDQSTAETTFLITLVLIRPLQRRVFLSFTIVQSVSQSVPLSVSTTLCFVVLLSICGIGGADRTFACKSQECLWQDWYICSFNFIGIKISLHRFVNCKFYFSAEI